jgi:hypothetical protein
MMMSTDAAAAAAAATAAAAAAPTAAIAAAATAAALAVAPDATAVPPAVPSAAPIAAAAAATSMKRSSLDGVWKLDKTRGQWTMRGYLETLKVNELAIQAHEKGELDQDTLNSISIENSTVRIIKRSRVNNDLVIELTLGEEKVEILQPGDRPKKSLATTEDPSTHLRIDSSLETINGMAHVTDIKRLVQEDDRTVLVQELTIVNEETADRNSTTRYFVPEDNATFKSNLSDLMEMG